MATSIDSRDTAVVTNPSDRSQDIVSEVFPVAFSEDAGARQYACHRTKMSYMVKFGLFPYFKNELHKLISKSTWACLMFDE